MLHIKITQFDSVASVVITSVASVAFWSQVSQVLIKPYFHNSYVVPTMTSERLLKHLKHLIRKKRNGLTEFMNLLPFERTTKIEFQRRTLPYTTVRSVGTPLYTLRESYNARSTLF